MLDSNTGHLLVDAGLTCGVLTFCLAMYKATNGRIDKKVNKEECHIAHKAMEQRLEQTERHIDTRFDDLKDFINKNGDKRG